MSRNTKKFDNVYIHVGLHKTGTSTIQSCLFSNRKSLESTEGYCYPSINKNHGGTIYTMFSDTPENFITNVKNNLTDPQKISEYKKKLFTLYQDEMSKTTATNLVISGESISLLSKKELTKLRDFFSSYSDNVYAVLWLRSPLEWCRSMSQQYIKQGLATLKEIESNPPVIEYRNIISLLTDVFGKKSLTITSFNDALTHTGGIFGRFCDDINISESFWEKIEPLKLNESASFESLTLISYLNESKPLIKNGYINEDRKPGDNEVFLDITGTSFDINISTKNKVMKAAEKDLEWLLDTYGIDYLSNYSLNNPHNKNTEVSLESFRAISDLIHSLFLSERKSSAYRRAEIHLFGKNYAKAKNILIRSEKRGDIDEHGFRLMSQIEFEIGNYEGALDYINKSLKIASGHKHFKFHRNKILKRLQEK